MLTLSNLIHIQSENVFYSFHFFSIAMVFVISVIAFWECVLYMTLLCVQSKNVFYYFCFMTLHWCKIHYRKMTYDFRYSWWSFMRGPWILYLNYIIDSSSNSKPITRCHGTTCSYMVKIFQNVWPEPIPCDWN